MGSNGETVFRLKGERAFEVDVWTFNGVESGRGRNPTPMLDVPEKGERWLCGDTYPSGGPVTVVLTRETPVAVRVGHGQVSVAGVVSEALFALNGVERRWDWDESAMVLKPDGDALFYDFRNADDVGRAKPSGFFACRRG